MLREAICNSLPTCATAKKWVHREPSAQFHPVPFSGAKRTPPCSFCDMSASRLIGSCPSCTQVCQHGLRPLPCRSSKRQQPGPQALKEPEDPEGGIATPADEQDQGLCDAIAAIALLAEAERALTQGNCNTTVFTSAEAPWHHGRLGHQKEHLGASTEGKLRAEKLRQSANVHDRV